MPRLVVQIDHAFEAGPLQARDANGRVKPLSPNKIAEMARDADPGEFSLSVVFLDPKDRWPVIGFELPRSGLKRSGTFEFTISAKTRRVAVKVKGELVSAPLRAGVAPHIQKMGRAADCRLQAFEYKGGMWSGFTAPIIGQGENDFENWFRITSWSLK